MRVAVFTGSAVGSEEHQRAAVALGSGLARAGVGVVYGGGRVGLMGVVADAALAAAGEVIGVMPQHLVDREIAHRGLTRLDVVVGMHERKARMAELADAFVALPGGAGTLEELFEVWTWGQLGLHAKATAVLDPDGFYSPLLAQLDAMTAGGYLSATYRNSLGVVHDTDALLDWIRTYQHPPSKWTSTPIGTATAPEPTDGQTAPSPDPHPPQAPDEAEPRAQLTSVGWVHVRDGRLLAVRTRGRDRYYLPGGKLELGESHEQALVREVREELGVSLQRLRPAFTVAAPAHGLARATTLTMHCYYATAEGELRPAREIEQTAWLDIPDDPRAAPAVAAVLAKIADADHQTHDRVGCLPESPDLTRRR